MKKSCAGCRALIQLPGRLEYYCSLKHPVESIKTIFGVPVEYRPLEQCEKPTTFKRLCAINLSKQ